MLLAVLISATPVGFTLRLLAARTPAPADRRPSWAHLVVVTCDRFPDDFATDGPGLRTLQHRAGLATFRAPPDPDLAASAATMWTGRRQRAEDLARASEATPWTLASSARSVGTATAAFVETTLIRDAQLTGFERVIEGRPLGPERLLELTWEHVDQHPDQRFLVWLHLADPGPRGERLDALIDGLYRELDRRGHVWDKVLVVTALNSRDGADIPVWVELPGAIFARRKGTGRTESSDVPGVIGLLIRVPIPDVTEGELPLESTINLTNLLRGGTVPP